MTSVLSTINPLYEKNQTLTRSIYTNINRQFRALDNAATAVTNNDGSVVAKFDGNNNFIVQSGDNPALVKINADGTIKSDAAMSTISGDTHNLATVEYVQSLNPEFGNYYNKAETDEKFVAKDELFTDREYLVITVQESGTSVPVNIAEAGTMALSSYTPTENANIHFKFNLKAEIRKNGVNMTSSMYNKFHWGLSHYQGTDPIHFTLEYFPDILNVTYNSSGDYITLSGQIGWQILANISSVQRLRVIVKDEYIDPSDTEWYGVVVTGGNIIAFRDIPKSHHCLMRVEIPATTHTITIGDGTSQMWKYELDANATYMLNFVIRNLKIQKIDDVTYDPTNATHRDILGNMTWRISVYLDNTWYTDVTCAARVRLNRGDIFFEGPTFIQTTNNPLTAKFKISTYYDGLDTNTHTITFALNTIQSQSNYIQVIKF